MMIHCPTMYIDVMMQVQYSLARSSLAFVGGSLPLLQVRAVARLQQLCKHGRVRVAAYTAHRCVCLPVNE